jgi:hypothetical protein
MTISSPLSAHSRPGCRLVALGFLSPHNWAVNREPLDAINTIATESIAAARLPVEDQISGVRALDLWRDGPNGAMLFWADAEADLNGRREPVLCDVCVQRTDGAGRAVGGASASSEALDELLAGLAPGLHRLGGSSADRVFLTWAVATPEVAMIRLRDASGRVRERPPGRHALVLLGVTSEDPLTHAYAVDRAGQQFPTEPLTLWAPPPGNFTIALGGGARRGAGGSVCSYLSDACTNQRDSSIEHMGKRRKRRRVDAARLATGPRFHRRSDDPGREGWLGPSLPVGLA